MTKAVVRMLSGLEGCDSTDMTGPPAVRLGNMLNRWFVSMVQRVETLEASIELEPSSLVLADGLVLHHSDLPASESAVLARAFAFGAPLLFRGRVVEGGDVVRYNGFVHNAMATRVLHRCPFARIIYDIFSAFPIHEKDGKTSQRVFQNRVQCYLEFIASLSGSRTLCRLAHEMSSKSMERAWCEEARTPDQADRWVIRRSGINELACLVQPCAAQVAMAKEVLSGCMLVDLCQQTHPAVRRLVGSPESVEEGAAATHVMVRHDPNSVDDVYVRTSDVYLATLEVLYEICGDLLAKKPLRGRWSRFSLPHTMLSAIIILSMNAKKYLSHFKFQTTLYNAMLDICVDVGVSPDDVSVSLPYLSPFDIKQAPNRMSTATSDRALHLLSVVHTIHRFPHAMRVSLATWVYLSTQMMRGKEVDGALLWDPYFIDVVNAFMGFKPLEALRGPADSLAQLLETTRGRAAIPFNRLVRQYSCIRDARHVYALASRHTELALLALHADVQAEDMVTVQFNKQDATPIDVIGSWDYFRKACEEHMVSVSSGETHVVYEMDEQTLWTLPSADFRCYMDAAPLLQTTFYFPCIANVLRLWSKREYHYMIISWAGRRSGAGDVTRAPTTRSEQWAEGVIRRLMAAGDVDGARAVLTEACSAAPASGERSSVSHALHDRAACRVAIDAMDVSKSQRHAHLVRLFSEIDAGDGAAADPLVLPLQRRAPPILVSRAPDAALAHGAIQSTSQLVVADRVLAKYSSHGL